ncbi:MAG: electron transfer flavoprotein subunit alpha/FixB family protein [Lewinellaceae bacterium]|nr:electron transfer flavoprotein subunit alpha/FixB family protein [Lewinellaceae bacterium]
MSVLIYVESNKGGFKKTAFEAVTYGRKTADALGVPCVALVLGAAENAGSLGSYGASRVLQVQDAGLENFDSQVYANVIAQAAESVGAQVVVLSQTANGKALLGRLAVRLDAGSVSGAIALPDTKGGFRVRKSVFSGKAFAEYELGTEKKVISLAGNSIPVEQLGSPVAVEALSVDVPAPKVRLVEIKRIEGDIPLPEAELVVSGGRGMKGPENWGILEDLGKALGATLACSRPVADSDWRPHHEHVGQTGGVIRPNLYIAVGISGAIQHLAGVNNSKVIVVINKDPEAPFFKAADYGVVGDLFEVVPRLTEAVKKFKAS